MQKISQKMCALPGLFFVGLFISVAFASPIFAQELPKKSAQFQPVPSLPLTPSQSELIHANTPGAVSCSDYYSSDSVQVDVAPYFTTLYPTDVLQFGGILKNNNPYPVVDGQIWMKIFKNEKVNDELLKENGYPLIDFVLIKDHVVIPAQSEIPLEFQWTVPKDMESGDYVSAFYFTTAHRYNLLGLTSTDNVTGNKASFTVNRVTPRTSVVFEKNTVHLNDVHNSFALPSRHFKRDEVVTAYATLMNNSENDRAVELTWTTYKWDGLLEVFKHSTETKKLVIGSGERIEESYQTPTLDTSVTFVIATVRDGDAQSMLNIRYVRDDILEARINFPSIMKYPLTAGQPVDMFSCVHSTNLPVVSDNSLILTLKDEAGTTLYTYTYNGDITDGMMAVKDTFTPDKTLGTFALTASLVRNGITVEEITTWYRCEELDPSQCIKKPSVIFFDNRMNILFLSGITTVSLLILYIFIRKSRIRKKINRNDDMHMPTNI